MATRYYIAVRIVCEKSSSHQYQTKHNDKFKFLEATGSYWSIDELIEEYEEEELRRSYFGPKFPRFNGFYNANLATWVGLNESEGTEVKDIEWAKEKLFEKAWEENKAEYLIHLESVYEVIDQLDTREVLNNEWIENHTACADNISHYSEEPVAVILVDDLKGLLLDPNLSNSMGLELPVIPKFVAEWIEEVKPDNSLRVAFEYIAQRKRDNHDDELAFWVEEGNSETFARAWLDGYTVEEEQKYIVSDNSSVPLLIKNDDGKVMAYDSQIAYNNANGTIELTEQEIKDYDERFWPFAVKVEGELEK